MIRTKGFALTPIKHKKQLTKGINTKTKDFHELLIRTINTEGAFIYIWRTINPLIKASTTLSNLYTYEVKKVDITQDTLSTLEALNDGIYLKTVGYIWESAIPTNMNITKLISQDFMGIGIDLDMFAQYVKKRIVNKGKFNINKRIFYLLGNKRVK